MRIDVVEEVAEGRAHVSWATVESTYRDKRLIIPVFRDAMKFDGVPALTWDWEPVPESDPWHTTEIFNGVRLPASAYQLQQIADLTGCMLLTPLVADLIWLQADTHFNSVTNTPRHPLRRGLRDPRRIVANSHIHVVHQEIEAALREAGGDDGHSLLSCEGKYWVLTNGLLDPLKVHRYGKENACNYGWHAYKASGPGVTPGTQCYQREGYWHDHNHWDPSQTIRLMYRRAMLIHEDRRVEEVDLHEIAASDLAPLIHHYRGKLSYLRQTCVPVPANDVAIRAYAPPATLVA